MIVENVYPSMYQLSIVARFHTDISKKKMVVANMELAVLGDRIAELEARGSIRHFGGRRSWCGFRILAPLGVRYSLLLLCDVVCFVVSRFASYYIS